MDIKKKLPFNSLECRYLIGLNFKSDFQFVLPVFINTWI